MSAFTDPAYVADALAAVLGALSANLTAAGRPVGRVFRSPGPPAWDCELLAVWPRTRIVSPGTQTDPSPIRRQVRFTLDVNLMLTRCLASASSESPPTVAALDADGAALAEDMWTIQRTLTEGVQGATLGLPGGCVVARFNPVTPAGPQGGFYGVTTTLEVGLG